MHSRRYKTRRNSSHLHWSYLEPDCEHHPIRQPLCQKSIQQADSSEPKTRGSECLEIQLSDGHTDEDLKSYDCLHTTNSVFYYSDCPTSRVSVSELDQEECWV